jgi:hypothetical protein
MIANLFRGGAASRARTRDWRARRGILRCARDDDGAGVDRARGLLHVAECHVPPVSGISRARDSFSQLLDNRHSGEAFPGRAQDAAAYCMACYGALFPIRINHYRMHVKRRSYPVRSLLKLRLAAISFRLFCPVRARPPARRHLHRGPRSLPSCRRTNARHRPAHRRAL